MIMTGRTIFKTAAPLLALLLVFQVCAVPLVLAVDGGAREIDVVDTMINYDPKMRVGRIILHSIQEYRARGEPVDWGRIKSQLFRRSILTHVTVDAGTNITAAVIQYTLMGVAPPLGTAAGAAISSLMCGFSGAIGYEISEDIDAGVVRSSRECFGRAMKRIDATNFAARTTGSIIGAIVGQAICPIPFLGVFIGGMLGGMTGGLLSNLIIKTDVGNAVGSKLQQGWNGVADWILTPEGNRRTENEEAGGPRRKPLADHRLVMKLRQKLMSLQSRYLELLEANQYQAASQLDADEIDPLREYLDFVTSGAE